MNEIRNDEVAIESVIPDTGTWIDGSTVMRKDPMRETVMRLCRCGKDEYGYSEKRIEMMLIFIHEALTVLYGYGRYDFRKYDRITKLIQSPIRNRELEPHQIRAIHELALEFDGHGEVLKERLLEIASSDDCCGLCIYK